VYVCAREHTHGSAGMLHLGRFERYRGSNGGSDGDGDDDGVVSSSNVLSSLGVRERVHDPLARAHTRRPTNRRTDRWMDGQTDGRTDERMDGGTDGQTDRYTNRYPRLLVQTTPTHARTVSVVCQLAQVVICINLHSLTTASVCEYQSVIPSNHAASSSVVNPDPPCAPHHSLSLCLFLCLSSPLLSQPSQPTNLLYTYTQKESLHVYREYPYSAAARAQLSDEALHVRHYEDEGKDYDETREQPRQFFRGYTSVNDVQ